jgi:hypothetical protein
MSRGRHSRPQARGGGLAALIAIAVAGGAVALAATEPTTRVLRLSIVGLAVLSSFQLLMLSRTQRSSTRAMARTEERLRTLEQRNREEGDELHRRVLAGVAREGELRRAVEVLVDEISRLRVSLEGFAPQAVPGAGAVPVAPAAATVATVEPAATVADAVTVDIPLIQRVFAAQEPELADVPGPGVPAAPVPEPELSAVRAALAEAAEAEVAPWPAAIRAAQPAPAAGELWRAPSRPEYVPAPPPVEAPVTSWVVREIQLDDAPGAALTMRILDLRTREAESASDVPDPAADELPTSTWTSFARPA